MTLTSLFNDKTIRFPAPPFVNFLSLTAHLLSASGHKVCVAFQAPATGSITGASFNTGTVTTGDTLTVNLKDVDTTTGFAGSTTHATGTVAVADTDDNTNKDVTFSASYSATKGEWLCLEIVNGSAGNLNIVGNNGTAQAAYVNPRMAHDSGSGYSFVTRLLYAAINYGGTYHYIPNLIHSVGSTSTMGNQATTTNDLQIGLKFRLPVPFSVAGVYMMFSNLANFKVNLWDSDGSTVLATKSFDSDVISNATTTTYSLLFDSAVDLQPNTWYRISITPTSGGNVGTYYQTAASTAKMSCYSCGQDAYGSTSNTHPPVEEADWSDDTTRLPGISVLISKLDNGLAGERHG